MFKNRRNGKRNVRVRRNNNNNAIIHKAQCAKQFVPPQEPRNGSASVMQTIRVQSNITFAASTGTTVTFANFLGNINGFTTGGMIKLLKLAIYAPTNAADFSFTVTDLLPNNDGLVMMDSGTTGAARAAVGYVPTELDRVTTHISGAVPIFSWTSNLALTGQMVIVATIQLRLS